MQSMSVWNFLGLGACAIAYVVMFHADSRSTALEDMHTDGRYVHVYGSSRCSYTTRLLQKLDASGVQYQYFSVNQAGVNDRMWQVLKRAGYTSNYVDYPVVDIDSTVKVRPNSDELILSLQRRAVAASGTSALPEYF